MGLDAALAAWFDAPRYEPLGQGHIHDTYRVWERDASFVLQRINEAVFLDGDLVMAQTARLLEHWSAQGDYVVPELCASRAGRVAERLDGELWRVWRYIDDTSVIDPLQTPAQAEAAGRAFGDLQVRLRDLPGERFEDPIVGFLQLDHYLGAFDAALAESRDALPTAVRARIDAHRSLAKVLSARDHLIHGDCKINNLLFDRDGRRVVAIIDFDTAMQGHWAWDLGDLVRSACFSSGGTRVDLFAAALRGFVDAGVPVTLQECVLAPGYVALMLGIRFLTDHISGNHYFKVAEHGENLERAQEQFVLFDELLAAQRDLEGAARRVLDVD